MILATHILIGGALAKPIIGAVNPLGAFAIGLAGHYLADAIPHCDYNLKSLKDVAEEGEFKLEFTPEVAHLVYDLLNIAIEVSAGILVLLLVVHPEVNWHNAFVYGALVFGSILPDALQPLSVFWNKFPFKQTQAFHGFWHSKKRIKISVAGFIPQAILALAAILVIWLV